MVTPSLVRDWFLVSSLLDLSVPATKTTVLPVPLPGAAWVSLTVNDLVGTSAAVATVMLASLAASVVLAEKLTVTVASPVPEVLSSTNASLSLAAFHSTLPFTSKVAVVVFAPTLRVVGVTENLRPVSPWPLRV